MKLFVPGPDGKPCIWPIPEDCLWNGERYDVRGCLEVWGDDCFLHEAELLASYLDSFCSAGARLGGSNADIRITRSDSPDLGEEGYTLDVTRHGAIIQAATCRGAFYGCQSLLQTVINSPDHSIHGVNIIDRPFNTKRPVTVFLPKREDIPLFKRFIDFLSRCKINTIILPHGDLTAYLDKNEINALLEYIAARHIKVLYEAGPACCICAPCTDDYTGRIYEIIRTSCTLWRKGYKAVKTTAGSIFPDYLEKMALQLYPAERNRINAVCSPFAERKKYKTFDIRKFYNAPLYRLSWRLDDYDYMYLANAGFLQNSIPFSVFQGADNLKLDPAFVLAGNNWNRSVSDIPIDSCVKNLSFLHSYLSEYRSAGQRITKDSHRQIVGYYIIHYRDGSTVKIEIAYGRDIFYWKADISGIQTAYNADPVFSGITFYGAPFVIHSLQWINPKPDIGVAKIDVAAVKGYEDGGIALFGITGVI